MKIVDSLIPILMIVIGALLFVLCYPRKTTAENNYYLDLQISNPYSLALELEVKCDWQSDRAKYKYYRKVYIPRKTVTNLSFPNHLKTCELWPRIDW